MFRPTIRDLANAAGVSSATVNRVLAGSTSVKSDTIQRVMDAAQDIGFRGLTTEQRSAAGKARYKLGFLLNPRPQAFYEKIAQALRVTAEHTLDTYIDLQIEFSEDFSPQTIAGHMLSLAETCDAIGVVSAVHPTVIQTIEKLETDGKPVFALISQLAATGRVPYIGLDNWKVGRTAAWICQHICKAPGKVGMLVGNPRFRCQELNESGFRSYFREYAAGFTLLEPMFTFEDGAIAEEAAEKLIKENPDIQGIYVAGGPTGVLSALRSADMAGKVTVVGHELVDATCDALLDGSMTFVISHPLDRLASEAIRGMIRTLRAKTDDGHFTREIPFDLFTRENV